MATDPEFLAMKSIQRAIESLNGPTTRRRVIDWAVSKVHTSGANSEALQHQPVVNPSNGRDVSVPQGQAIQG